MRKLGFSSWFKQTIACLCLTVSRVQFMTNAVPKHPLWAWTLVEKVISFMYVCWECSFMYMLCLYNQNIRFMLNNSRVKPHYYHVCIYFNCISWINSYGVDRKLFYASFLMSIKSWMFLKCWISFLFPSLKHWRDVYMIQFSLSAYLIIYSIMLELIFLNTYIDLIKI